jgi:ribonuclease T2
VQSDLVQYFRKSLTTFQELPTYEWLASDGIVPSLDVTYTRAEIDASLRKHFGREVEFRCRSGALNEMWYHYNAVGGIISGDLIPGDPVGGASNCPA